MPRRPAIADAASARYSDADFWTATEPDTSYCGRSHERRFGSFQIDHSFTVGYRVPSARTNWPNSCGLGLHTRLMASEPRQREAQAGIGPVGVSRTCIPRA